MKWARQVDAHRVKFGTKNKYSILLPVRRGLRNNKQDLILHVESQINLH